MPGADRTKKRRARVVRDEDTVKQTMEEAKSTRGSMCLSERNNLPLAAAIA